MQDKLSAVLKIDNCRNCGAEIDADEGSFSMKKKDERQIEGPTPYHMVTYSVTLSCTAVCPECGAEEAFSLTGDMSQKVYSEPAPEIPVPTS